LHCAELGTTRRPGAWRVPEEVLSGAVRPPGPLRGAAAVHQGSPGHAQSAGPPKSSCTSACIQRQVLPVTSLSTKDARTGLA